MSGAIWPVSAMLFVLGLAALVLRRRLLAMFLGLELMVVAGALALGQQAASRGLPEGMVAALLALAVAAAEAVVGLTLILRLHWAGRAIETESIRELHG